MHELQLVDHVLEVHDLGHEPIRDWVCKERDVNIVERMRVVLLDRYRAASVVRPVVADSVRNLNSAREDL